MPKLIEDCISILSPNARFLLLNAYATNTSEIAIHNLLQDAARARGGNIESGQLCLKQKNDRLISTGIFTRWTPTVGT